MAGSILYHSPACVNAGYFKFAFRADQIEGLRKAPAPDVGRPPADTPGERVEVLGPGRVWLGTNKALADEMNQLEKRDPRAADARAQNEGGATRSVPSGSVGIVIESTDTHTRISVDTGPNTFKSGWVPNRFVRPAKETKVPEPKTPEPKKADSSPPNPKDDVIDGRATAERQAIYAKLFTALAQIEAAAIKRFGKKPTKDDPLSLSVPYQAYVDFKRNKLFSDLFRKEGVLRPQAEAILKEGDTKGWPNK